MMPTTCHPQNPTSPPPYHGNSHSQTWPHPATSTATSMFADIRQQATMQQLNQPLRPAMTATQSGLSRAVTRSHATLDRGASDWMQHASRSTCLWHSFCSSSILQLLLHVCFNPRRACWSNPANKHIPRKMQTKIRQLQCCQHCMPATSHDATWVTRCVEQATRIPEPSPTSTWL